MRAKKILTLAIPVMLLAGCTIETYGLTQSEYRLVDKEFKADEMVEHMKKMHYSDEEIERQLRGALATVKAEKELKEGKTTKKEEVDTDSYSRGSKSETSKSDKDSDTEEREQINEKEYPYRLFELLVDFQYNLKGIEKESELMVSEDEIITPPTLDYIDRARKSLDKFESIAPPKKYRETHDKVVRAVNKTKRGLNSLEGVVKDYEDKKIKHKELKEELDRTMTYVKEGQDMYEPVFREFDKEFTDAKQKALDKLRKEVVDSASKPSYEDNVDANEGTFKLSKDAKELEGEWGTYRFEKYNLGFNFKKDGSYTMYGSDNKEDRKENYAIGKWTYNADKHELTFKADKFVEKGKNIESPLLTSEVTYELTSFTGDTFAMKDERGNLVRAKKQK
ncbi:hypothetical protein COF68_04865 [Bacillus toyonensis]|uniref:DUF3994 domain-containing protein n=1 Tax=Bacillus toyonensis TaxID=155322 RepID=UPI000BFB1735|nr:DUF3994 domain-containing protein [Bacillus toyonensis]PHE64182.1 hypothetical protein COF68_04865 [Bacillus toyonensis]